MYSKELIRGTLSTLVMNLLKEHGKMYGYEIAQKVKEISGDTIELKEGSLYPLLHKLEGEGLLEVSKVNIGKRVRKYYEITQSGKSAVAEKITELKSFMKTLQGFLNTDPEGQLST